MVGFDYRTLAALRTRWACCLASLVVTECLMMVAGCSAGSSPPPPPLETPSDAATSEPVDGRQPTEPTTTQDPPDSGARVCTDPRCRGDVTGSWVVTSACIREPSNTSNT